MTLVVPADAVRAARSLAAVRLERLLVRDARLVPALEHFLATYAAVYQYTTHHHASVHVASRDTLPRTPGRPRPGTYAYPEAAGALLRDVELDSVHVPSYLQYCRDQSARLLRGAPPRITLGGVAYDLGVPSTVPSLVGVEAEQQRLHAITRRLFLYDPASQSNVDAECFPRTIALVGPPGSGKSSLLASVVAEARRLEQIVGTPLCVETYDASNFSSYFGRSARLLKEKLHRVCAADGVGLFIVEDVDMVLQSRSDSFVQHGVLQVQQILMNAISGLQPWLGNTLTLLTTNRYAALDAALQSRVGAALVVDPFQHRAAHAAYFAMHVPHLSLEAQQRLACLAHERCLSGRDLAAVLAAAREVATRPPSDEELRDKVREDRCSPIDADTLAALVRSRFTAG